MIFVIHFSQFHNMPCFALHVQARDRRKESNRKLSRIQQTKTLIIREFSSKKELFLLPKQELLKQLEQTFACLLTMNN